MILFSLTTEWLLLYLISRRRVNKIMIFGEARFTTHQTLSTSTLMFNVKCMEPRVHLSIGFYWPCVVCGFLKRAKQAVYWNLFAHNGCGNETVKTESTTRRYGSSRSLKFLVRYTERGPTEWKQCLQIRWELISEWGFRRRLQFRHM